MYESVPPRLYGGTERVVAHLCNALVSQGHDVTLFASADARTRARLVPMRQQALRLDPAPLKSDLASHMVLLQDVGLAPDLGAWKWRPEETASTAHRLRASPSGPAGHAAL